MGLVLGAKLGQAYYFIDTRAGLCLEPSFGCLVPLPLVILDKCANLSILRVVQGVRDWAVCVWVCGNVWMLHVSVHSTCALYMCTLHAT